MNDKRYEAQVQLLLRILPHVAAEDCFALKGGTAINLFVRALPRLSVDIDLTYVPIDEREASLAAIFAALGRIRSRVMKAIPGIRIPVASHVGGESKLVCLLGGANVKIEVNTTLRGVLWPTRELTVSEVVEDAYGYSATIQVVSHAELFGGKVAAALDRQHPRDLFDLWQLYEHEGLTDEVFRGFLVPLISHGRPMHELLAPNLLDQQSVFTTQFEGMTRLPFSYEDFVVTRARLLTELRSWLTEDDRQFLLGLKQGMPDWTIAPVEGVEELPAVKWKLENIRRLARNRRKHAAHLERLRRVLESSSRGHSGNSRPRNGDMRGKSP